MKKRKLPKNFDGAKFAAAFGLDPLSGDFYANDGYLFYPESIGKVNLNSYAIDLPLEYVENRHQAYIEAGCTGDAVIEAIIEAVVENRPEKLNALQAKRENIKREFPKPQAE